MAETNKQPNELEQRLIEAVVRGELLDLAGDGPVDVAAMESWGLDRGIRAWVLRDIVRGRLAADPDPRGLCLRGARISGCLDLVNITSDLDLELSDCLLPDGLVLRDARLWALVLSGCRIGQPAGSTDAPIDATRFTARGMWLDGSILSADSPDAAVRLPGAHISGQLDCTGAQLGNTAGPALHADNLQVEQDVVLRGGFTATGVSDLGAVRLLGARIVQLDCTGAQLSNTAGPALHADSLQVDRSVFLRDGFTATGSGDEAVIILSGAGIGGALQLDTSQVTRACEDVGPMVDLDGMTKARTRDSQPRSGRRRSSTR